jgi:hypothetical protein
MDIVVLYLNKLKTLACTTLHSTPGADFVSNITFIPCLCPHTFMHVLGRFCTMSKIEG